jgi:DNA (cytosine-5)-methyltransferase 1
MIKVGSDFSGVGAFDQALIKLVIKHETLFACDMDKYARQTYTLNFGEPIYYPSNVYDREIPNESLDIYMSSPPCQAFSLAGKRKGEEDKRGILFYNTHEFIFKNNPRFFIIENVKGLLSDDSGKTFQRWIDLLAGKSVNGNPVIFPHEESTPYHVYYQVLNAKHYGVPQNRERIFIIGIRDDADNNFTFPKSYPLEKRLKDVLESEVDKKYFLSDKMLDWIDKHREKRGSSNKYPLDESDIGSCMVARYGKNGAEDPYIKIPTNNSKGFDIAEEEEDSINFSVPSSKTRRGRVGHKVAQTLDTQCNQGIVTKQMTKQQLEKLENLEVDENIAGCITEAIGRADSSDEYIASVKRNAMITQRIRRLTPTKCFRLMDFNDDFIEKTIGSKLISDSQMYKQAGNSIVVNCLVEIIKKLNL